MVLKSVLPFVGLLLVLGCKPAVHGGKLAPAGPVAESDDNDPEAERCTAEYCSNEDLEEEFDEAPECSGEGCADATTPQCTSEMCRDIAFDNVNPEDMRADYASLVGTIAEEPEAKALSLTGVPNIPLPTVGNNFPLPNIKPVPYALVNSVPKFGVTKLPALSRLGFDPASGFMVFGESGFTIDSKFSIYGGSKLPSGVVAFPPNTQISGDTIKVPGKKSVTTKEIGLWLGLAKQNPSSKDKLSKVLIGKYGTDFGVGGYKQIKQKYFISFGGYGYGPAGKTKGVPYGKGVSKRGQSYAYLAAKPTAKIAQPKLQKWGKFLLDWQDTLKSRKAYVKQKKAMGWSAERAKAMYIAEVENASKETTQYAKSFWRNVNNVTTGPVTETLIGPIGVSVYPEDNNSWSWAVNMPGTPLSAGIDQYGNLYFGSSVSLAAFAWAVAADAQMWVDFQGSANPNDWLVGVYGSFQPVGGGVPTPLGPIGQTGGGYISVTLGTVGSLSAQWRNHVRNIMGAGTLIIP